jgi:hypothetical protein
MMKTGSVPVQKRPNFGQLPGKTEPFLNRSLLFTVCGLLLKKLNRLSSAAIGVHRRLNIPSPESGVLTAGSLRNRLPFLNDSDNLYSHE